MREDPDDAAGPPMKPWLNPEAHRRWHAVRNLVGTLLATFAGIGWFFHERGILPLVVIAVGAASSYFLFRWVGAHPPD